MKKIFLFAALFITVANLVAQNNSVTTKSATVKPASILKTLNDSVSYVVGFSIGNSCKQQGLTNLNSMFLSKAINDVLTGKKTLLNDKTANVVMSKYMGTRNEKVNPAASKTVSVLKTLTDSASYAIGMNAGNFYKTMGITKLNTTLVSK